MYLALIVPSSQLLVALDILGCLKGSREDIGQFAALSSDHLRSSAIRFGVKCSLSNSLSSICSRHPRWLICSTSAIQKLSSECSVLEVGSSRLRKAALLRPQLQASLLPTSATTNADSHGEPILQESLPSVLTTYRPHELYKTPAGAHPPREPSMRSAEL